MCQLASATFSSTESVPAFREQRDLYSCIENIDIYFELLGSDAEKLIA
jgi:hypothetical protein